MCKSEEIEQRERVLIFATCVVGAIGCGAISLSLCEPDACCIRCAPVWRDVGMAALAGVTCVCVRGC